MSFQVLKSEFAEWREMAITKEFYRVLMEQAEFMAAEILNRVDENPKRDMYCKGLIKAIDLAISWTPELKSKVLVNPETGQLEETTDVD